MLRALALSLCLLSSAVLPSCGGAAQSRASEARSKANSNAVDIDRLQRRVEQLERRLEALEASK